MTEHKKQKTESLLIRLDPGTKARLKAAALFEGVKVSEFVRYAIDCILGKSGAKEARVRKRLSESNGCDGFGMVTGNPEEDDNYVDDAGVECGETKPSLIYLPDPDIEEFLGNEEERKSLPYHHRNLNLPPLEEDPDNV